jgi:methionine-rich copper-binding protein CopC
MSLSHELRAWVLLLGASAAQAHPHLQQVTPADGSVVTSAPTQLVLRFSEAARLSVLAIGQGEGPRQKLTPLPQQSQATIVVKLPPLSPGRYVVSWRVMGVDGHVVPGEIHFTLKQ